MSTRKLIAASVALSVIAAHSHADDPAIGVPKSDVADANWKIAIVPNAKEQPPKLTAQLTAYEQAYAGMPFRRTLYENDPTYRHQAAMEFAFGKLRPMVNYRFPMRPLPNDPRGQGRSPFFPYDFPATRDPYPSGVRATSQPNDLSIFNNNALFFRALRNRRFFAPFFAPAGGFRASAPPLLGP